MRKVYLPITLMVVFLYIIFVNPYIILANSVSTLSFTNPVQFSSSETIESQIDLAKKAGETWLRKSSIRPGAIEWKNAYLSNPSSPREISRLDTQGVARRILINDNLAYVVDWRKPPKARDTFSILIVDVADRAKPRELGSIELPPDGIFNFTQYDNYIYYSGADPSIKIINIYAKEK